MITIRFTCGDTKILSNIKMSQNIMTRIVEKLVFTHLNVSSIGNKSEMLSDQIKDNIDVLIGFRQNS